ncbi:MAG: hypothetical protein JXK05_12305 [Campylobacterales bacterium]|nr:hypothetical protein [Campylobacterales bacterium]
MRGLQLAALAWLTCNALGASESHYSLRLAGGWADHHDFGQILSLDAGYHHADTALIGIDGGYLLHRFELPFELYAKGGVYRYLENGHQEDFFETTAYLKLYYNADFWDQRLRIGLAEGGSYAFEIPMVEKLEAQESRDNNSKFLNYLEVSIDASVGKLLHVIMLEQTYIGWTLKHRSGIYGLINNVRRGGSNYNMVHIETHF